MNYKYLNYSVFVFFLAFTSVLASSDDSITVVEKNGRQVIVYEVGLKETMYSIARKYNVSPKAIIALNPEVENGLKVGQKIFVPLIPRSAIQQAATSVPVVTEGKIFHTVEPKQTLFSISKRYNVSVDDIKKWNDLSGNDLKVGSSIIVGINNPSVKTASSDGKESELTKQTTRSNSGNERTIEKGSAEIFETAEGSTFHYALHRTAPTGSIIKVQNETTGNSVFVRVIGKLPATTNNQTVIKLSKIACERLGATTDGRPFKVEISYLQ